MPLQGVVLLLLSCCRNEGLVVQDHDLLVFLKALHNQLDTIALHPEPRHLVGSWDASGSGCIICVNTM